jgi:ATP-dependent DNA helicase DinG
MSRYVVLDLETTGVSYAEGDRIIQLAYTVIEEKKIVKTFNTLINSETTIPAFVQQLTQIQTEDLAKAPSFEEIVPELMEDLNNSCFVAHNVDFDLHFLNETLEDTGYTPYEGPVLDTVELSRIAFPSESGYRLSELAENLSLHHVVPHQADSDAYATAELFLKISEVFRKLPRPALKHLLGIEHMLKSSLRPLLEEWFEQAEDAAGELEVYRGIALRKINYEAAENENIEADFNEVFADFQTGKTISKVMPGFIRRSGQEEMINFVHQIFTGSKIGLVEAGTGTGKTLAYLLPAAYYAAVYKEKVVISTETIQLQEQLLKKEVPLVEKLLPFPVKPALLKGRTHYVCLQKVENLLDLSFQESYERMVSKAQIVVWLTITGTGDVEELNLADASDRFLREVSSDIQSCAGPDCPWFSRCFYQRAKKAAKAADVVITNHAMLLSDIVHESQILPSYSSVIIDEAHHLEEAATRHFGTQLDYASMAQLLNDFTTRGQDNVLEPWLSLYTPEMWKRCKEKIQQAREEWNDLFLSIYSYADKGAGRGETGDISKVIVRDESWNYVLEAAHRFHAVFTEAVDELKKIELEISSDTSTGPAYKNEQTALDRYIHEMDDLHRKFMDLITHQQEDNVYWMERALKGPKQSITIFSSPTEVSQLLADRFFQKKKRVILTSATLTVNQSFNFVIRQLGLEDFEVETKVVASPFNWSEQVALMIPNDIPLIQEAGEDAYIHSIAQAIYQTAEVTEGKMLVLFTSYDMLRKTYHLVSSLLDDSYMLIGQGIQSKSRTKLVKMFQQFDRTILFGTSSFWEGVDIPGEDLSVIVMARLPFSPPSDPVFKAKSDKLKQEGASPFIKLALPQAVLRFKQGFGRLIRRETDRGIVIVLDRRIDTARYGKQFVKSLPDMPVHRGSIYDLETEIDAWLHKPLKESVYDGDH